MMVLLFYRGVFWLKWKLVLTLVESHPEMQVSEEEKV